MMVHADVFADTADYIHPSFSFDGVNNFLCFKNIIMKVMEANVVNTVLAATNGNARKTGVIVSDHPY